jgi:hypothetical protein
MAIDTTPVRYIGKRKLYRDGTYGTGEVFKKGESVMIPVDVAIKMLQHADVYRPGNVLKARAMTKTAAIDPIEDTQDARDLIMAVEDPHFILEYARTEFGRVLDATKSMFDLRQETIQLIDLYGLGSV